MPTSEKARRAGFAELSRRKEGSGKKAFKCFGDEALEDYLHEPLHSKGGKSKGRGKRKSRSSKDQADALRGRPF